MRFVEVMLHLASVFFKSPSSQWAFFITEDTNVFNVLG